LQRYWPNSKITSVEVDAFFHLVMLRGYKHAMPQHHQPARFEATRLIERMLFSPQPQRPRDASDYVNHLRFFIRPAHHSHSQLPRTNLPPKHPDVLGVIKRSREPQLLLPGRDFSQNIIEFTIRHLFHDFRGAIGINSLALALLVTSTALDDGFEMLLEQFRSSLERADLVSNGDIL